MDPLPTHASIPSSSTTSSQEEDTPIPSDRMTLGRKFAQRHATSSWYHPLVRNTPNIPNLDAAWDYFEQIALPRCIRGHDQEILRVFPGQLPNEESPSQLYPVLSTPYQNFQAFGIGITLYFEFLMFLGGLAFIAGCFHLPSILYFGNEYTNNSESSLSKWILNGSAVCTHVTWQPCPSCIEKQNDGNSFHDRMIFGTSSLDGSAIAFIQKNECKLGYTVGIWTMCSIFLVVFAVGCFIHVQEKKLARWKMHRHWTSQHSLVVKVGRED